MGFKEYFICNIIRIMYDVCHVLMLHVACSMPCVACGKLEFACCMLYATSHTVNPQTKDLDFRGFVSVRF